MSGDGLKNFVARAQAAQREIDSILTEHARQDFINEGPHTRALRAAFEDWAADAIGEFAESKRGEFLYEVAFRAYCAGYSHAA